MLKLPIFKQIPYISPTAFLSYLNCEYKTYLTRQSGLPFIPAPSSLYAEIGTAFDAFVKEAIVVKRKMQKSVSPALKLQYMLKDIKHQDAIVEGREAALRYIKLPIFQQFLTAKEVYLDQELRTTHGTKTSNEAVPILGRIDAIVDGRVIEWKMRGWGSRASPYAGYCERYDCNYSSGSIVSKGKHGDIKLVEEFSFEWAAQILWYNWLLRNIPRVYEIHEGVKREDGVTFVVHRGQVGEAFEENINKLLFRMWEKLTGQLYFAEVDRPIPARECCNKWNVLCEVAQHCEFYTEWSKNGFAASNTTIDEETLHQANPMQFFKGRNGAS